MPAARKPARGHGVDAGTAARELLHVVMLVMRTVAANMRRSPDSLAPAQMGTLMKVSVGPCTMSALARHLSVSPPTVSKSVDMLVRRGWLERWVDKHDRRQTMVRLTTEGRRVLANIKKRTEKFEGKGKSPDDGDALALTFAMPVQVSDNAPVETYQPRGRSYMAG